MAGYTGPTAGCLQIYAIIPCPDPITGGVEADLRIVEELRSRGHTVQPIFFGNVRGTAPPYSIWNQLRFNLILIRQLYRAPKGFVLLEDQALSGAVGLANRYLGKRRKARTALITYHLSFNVRALWRNPIRRYVRRLVERSVARNVDLILASSESTKRELLAEGVAADRVRVIRLGISPRRAMQKRPESGEEEGIVRLLTVGTVEPRKGLIHLVQALGQLCDKRWQLDIVGAADGEHQAALVDAAHSLGIADRIRFHGRVSDAVVDELMTEASVYVSPSLAEGFGLAVLEAMHAGVPVVVSAAGALPELVEDGQSGLLVPPADSVALAAALRRLIDDEALRRELGGNAARAVAGRYTWEEAGRQVDEALWKLTAFDGRLRR